MIDCTKAYPVQTNIQREIEQWKSIRPCIQVTEPVEFTAGQGELYACLGLITSHSCPKQLLAV
jgi:hypothetical protein